MASQCIESILPFASQWSLFYLPLFIFLFLFLFISIPLCYVIILLYILPVSLYLSSSVSHSFISLIISCYIITPCISSCFYIVYCFFLIILSFCLFVCLSVSFSGIKLQSSKKIRRPAQSSFNNVWSQINSLSLASKVTFYRSVQFIIIYVNTSSTNMEMQNGVQREKNILQSFAKLV